MPPVIKIKSHFDGQLYKDEQWVHKRETQFDKKTVCFPEVT